MSVRAVFAMEDRKVEKSEIVKLFADDINLFIYDADIDMLNDRANHSICELHRWFLANKLSLISLKHVLWYFLLKMM
jgi:hypothetical protein